MTRALLPVPWNPRHPHEVAAVLSRGNAREAHEVFQVLALLGKLRSARLLRHLVPLADLGTRGEWGPMKESGRGTPQASLEVDHMLSGRCQGREPAV